MAHRVSRRRLGRHRWRSRAEGSSEGITRGDVASSFDARGPSSIGGSGFEANEMESVCEGCVERTQTIHHKGGHLPSIGGHLGITESAPKRDAAYTYRSQPDNTRRFVSHVTSWMRVTLWSADLRRIGRIGSLGPRIEPTKHKNAKEHRQCATYDSVV